ncbi:hypothetical protein ACFE04_007217 [Oxalis oulophora]
MGFVKTLAFISILVLLQPLVTLSDMFSSLTPLIAPIFDDVCKEVGCGKGTCKPSTNTSFFFECECDAGWKQLEFDWVWLLLVLAFSRLVTGGEYSWWSLVDLVLGSIDYSCEGAAPASAPVQSTKLNESVFDPCHWTDCGGGSCNKTSSFSYNCLCEVGYDNLMNLTSLPCYKECAFGVGCSDLGISFSNPPGSSSPPALDDSGGKNQGIKILQLNHLWLVGLMISLSIMMIQ